MLHKLLKNSIIPSNSKLDTTKGETQPENPVKVGQVREFLFRHYVVSYNCFWVHHHPRVLPTLVLWVSLKFAPSI